MAAVFFVAGCVSTVDGRRTPGVPFVKDSVQGNYERPVDQIAEAAKEVIKFNGTLLNESTLHKETNAVRTVEGKVKGRTIWVRISAAAPNISSVEVQARTSAGGTDIGLAHEIEKQIALKLVK